MFFISLTKQKQTKTKNTYTQIKQKNKKKTANKKTKNELSRLLKLKSYHFPPLPHKTTGNFFHVRSMQPRGL